MKLTHWVPPEFVDAVLAGKGLPHEGFDKPAGFWLSVDGDWEDWCKRAGYGGTTGRVCLIAELKPEIKLFKPESKEEFLAEFKRLTGEAYPGRLQYCRRMQLIELFHEKLRAEYDGIWATSKMVWGWAKGVDFNDFNYFYGWDCESICVWNKDKVIFSKIDRCGPIL